MPIGPTGGQEQAIQQPTSERRGETRESTHQTPKQRTWHRIGQAARNLLPDRWRQKAKLAQEAGQSGMAALAGKEMPAKTQEQSRFPNPDRYYQDLTEREKALADPSEVIPTYGFTDTSEDQADMQRLISAGIPEDAVRRGEIKRGDLLAHGFIFHNRIGVGQKPILSGTITVNGQEVDLSSRRFLTQTELDAVAKQQKQLHPESLQPGTLEMAEVRRDMLGFLIEGDKMVSREVEVQTQVAESVLSDLLNRNEITRQQLSDYLAEGGRAWKELGFDEREGQTRRNIDLFRSSTAGLDLLRIRGIPVTALLIRVNKLQGTPSPFLDSGFHFDDNWDVTLNKNDKDNTRRVNMVVWHLLSRGLSEMGGSRDGSHDKTYMTGAEYTRDVYSRRDEPSTEGQLTDAERDRVALRIRSRIAPDTVREE